MGGRSVPLVEELVTRAATGDADLEIVWGVTKEYLNGPDYALAAMTFVGGITASVLMAMFRASLIRRNRVINDRVELATAALRLSGAELADKNAELARAHELVRHAFGRYVSEEVAESRACPRLSIPAARNATRAS